MEKNIKDYLHLYWGCNCRMNERFPGGNEVYNDGKIDEMFLLHQKHRTHADITIRPILRPLSSMTEDEAKEIWYATGGRYSVTNPKHVFTSLGHENFTSPREWFAITRLLLSKGFDLFNLIPEGLAIDPTLKPM